MNKRKNLLLTIAGLGAAVLLGCCALAVLGNLLGPTEPAAPVESLPSLTPTAGLIATLAPAETFTPSLPAETPIPATAAPAPLPTPEPQSFNGSGKQASSKFALNPGLAIFKMKASGQGNFAIILLDSTGQTVDLLANELGAFDGSKAISATGGDYVMDITADSDWSVTIEQPGPPQTLAGPPLTLNGNGQQATEFFNLAEGLTTFKATHNGPGNFAIILLDQNGQVIDLLFNELGAFDGSKATGVDTPGAYLLDIAADGDWTVTIEQ